MNLTTNLSYGRAMDTEMIPSSSPGDTLTLGGSSGHSALHGPAEAQPLGTNMALYGGLDP